MRTLIKNLEENKEVVISGFAETIRNTKYMVFVILKDTTGKIQVSIDKENNKDIVTALEGVISGSVLSFKGKMVKSEYVKQGGC